MRLLESPAVQQFREAESTDDIVHFLKARRTELVVMRTGKAASGYNHLEYIWVKTAGRVTFYDRGLRLRLNSKDECFEIQPYGRPSSVDWLPVDGSMMKYIGVNYRADAYAAMERQEEMLNSVVKI